jgi:hypothetical protein
MRVEIVDWVGQPYTITSRKPELIGKWFAEHAGNLMSADNRAAIRINIWPQDIEEMKLIGKDSVTPFTQDGLLALAERILEASKKLGDLESAAADDR